MRTKKFVAAFVAGLLLLVAGCSAVPEQLQATIKELPSLIENSRKAVDEAEKVYNERMKDQKYAFTQGYTPEQMRAERFATARTNLNEAAAVYEGQVKPLEKDFKIEQQSALETEVNKVRDLIKLAQANANEPARWADYVVLVKASPGKVMSSSQATASSLSASYDTLSQQVGTAVNDFDHQKPAITKKQAPFIELHSQGIAALETLQTESEKSTPNYAVMAGAADAIDTNAKKFSEAVPTLKNELDGLYVRETHTLIDIRVDSVLYLGRTSWNESSDFGEKDYDFAGIPVDSSTADYFAQFPADTVLATYNAGFLGGDFKVALRDVDQAQWDKLKLNLAAGWPESSHNSSEIWMDEIDDTYCHKLKVLKNGEPDASNRPKTDVDDSCVQYNTQADLDNGIYWEESDELLNEAIGMDIYAKAYGDFPEQAIDVATPPGISYVGDPATGEWQTDATGNSFWHYYGYYRFFGDLIGGPYPYYYRSQYDSWDKARYSGTPYYMPDSNGANRFGGKSPQTATRFKSSNFGTSGLQDATVRNSGPVARSGGPGGGGK